MKKRYTDEDLIEIEKLHRDNYVEIHKKILKIYDSCDNKSIKTMLEELENLVYDKEADCQRDIIISEQDIAKSTHYNKKV